MRYKAANGALTDEKLHEPILNAVKFSCTPAYRYAIERLIVLGLSVAEAAELMSDQLPQ